MKSHRFDVGSWRHRHRHLGAWVGHRRDEDKPQTIGGLWGAAGGTEKGTGAASALARALEQEAGADQAEKAKNLSELKRQMWVRDPDF